MTNRRTFIKFGTFATLALMLPAYSDTKSKEAKMSKSGILGEFYSLNNGLKIPKLGLGLWRVENEKTPFVVSEAIKIGYRHFDSAQSYANEEGLGVAINEALQKGFKREDFYITSKIRAEYKDYESAKNSIDESLKKLNLTILT